MESVFRDIRYGLRSLLKSPGLTIVATLALGLALAAGVAQFTRVILFQVEPRDPAIFGGVVLVLSAAGLLACLLPARRAARVDPVVALRTE
jgi:ABC-type antimicrobial peptide transport system permease subunit